MGVRRVQNALHAERARHAVDAAGAAHREHGVPAALLLDLVELRAGFGESLVPADALPLVAATFAHALHGVLNALALDQLHRDARPASAHALNIAIRIWDLGSTRENHVVVAHHGSSGHPMQALQ